MICNRSNRIISICVFLNCFRHKASSHTCSLNIHATKRASLRCIAMYYCCFTCCVNLVAKSAKMFVLLFTIIFDQQFLSFSFIFILSKYHNLFISTAATLADLIQSGLLSSSNLFHDNQNPPSHSEHVFLEEGDERRNERSEEEGGGDVQKTVVLKRGGLFGYGR